LPWEIIRPDTTIDFIGKRRLCAALSASLILAAAIAIPINGVRLGIDFAGGTEVQLEFAPGVQASDGAIRTILIDALEISEPSVIRFGEEEENAFLIKFPGNINEGLAAGAEAEGDAADADVQGTDLIVKLERAIEGAIGSVSIERVEFVGPRVGAELRRDGLQALLFASIAILIYIAFRFNTRFAPGAIAAVLHDLSITAGVFIILGMEFDLRILAAMLAILGYSLNDTIIIYDRVRENMLLHTSLDLPEVLNQSVNQTLSRTVLTSGSTLAALLSLYFLGGPVIQPFAFAMILGVIVGTYSSIYIAAPVLLILERRYGKGAAKEVADRERQARVREQASASESESVRGQGGRTSGQGGRKGGTSGKGGRGGKSGKKRGKGRR
jgi:preprotein translocase subunit SecF